MSRERIDEMLAAAERAGVEGVSGYCFYVAGVLHMRNSDAPAATDYLSRALELQERAADRRGQALTLLNLGNVTLLRGDVAGAAHAYERMVEMAGEDEMPSLAVAGLLNLCHVLMTLGRLDRLGELFERGEQLVDRLHDEARGCVLAYMRATWYREVGRVDESVDLLREASRRAGEFGLPRLQSHIHNELGLSYLARAEKTLARAEFERSVELASSDSMRAYRTHAIRGLALTDLAESSLAAAELHAREAVEVAIGADRLHEADGLVVLARIQLALGRPEAAIEYGEQALAIHRETGHFLGTARAPHGLGEARADRDQLYEALRMFEEFGSPEAADVRRTLDG
jgi:tetratricopeptide (TPR) repeat protein